MSQDQPPDASQSTLVEDLLREVTAQDAELSSPPSDVWDRIAAEVDHEPAGVDVVSLDSRRRLPLRAVLGGVVAAIVLLLAGFAVLARSSNEDPTVVATADLSYDPTQFDVLGADASAQVALVDDGGTLRIDVENSRLPTPNGENADLELWLIEPDADGNPAELVSLGTVDPERPGEFAVPATTDPSVFSVVDISVEPRDGNAQHSGRSILRGSFTAV